MVGKCHFGVCFALKIAEFLRFCAVASVGAGIRRK